MPSSLEPEGRGRHRVAAVATGLVSLVLLLTAWFIGQLSVCWAPGLADGGTVPPVAGFRETYCAEEGSILEWIVALGVLYLIPIVAAIVAVRAAARGQRRRALLMALAGPAVILVFSTVARLLPPQG